MFCLSQTVIFLLQQPKLTKTIAKHTTQACGFSCLSPSPHIVMFFPPVAAKSLQSCPTLCDPIDGSPPGSAISGILQARTREWVAISFSNAWKWKVKVKLLSRVWLLVTPWIAAYQAPPSMGFSKQEYWGGVPLPSPFHQLYRRFSFLSVWPHGRQHTRFPCPSLPPRACWNSCPLSRWCHPTISSSVAPFSSCPQSFPASGSFSMSQLFTSGHDLATEQQQQQIQTIKIKDLESKTLG